MKWKLTLIISVLLIVVSMVIANQTTMNNSSNVTINVSIDYEINTTINVTNGTQSQYINESANISNVNQTNSTDISVNESVSEPEYNSTHIDKQTVQESIEDSTLEEVVQNQEPVIEDPPSNIYTEYITIGKKFNIAPKNILIEHETEDRKSRILFNISSTSDSHLIGDFEETKEWAYEKAGSETLTSDQDLIIIGDHICIKDNYHNDGSGLLRQKTYSDCVYYPPHNVEVEKPSEDGTNSFDKQTRKIIKMNDKQVKIDYEDDYDPTAEEMTIGLQSYYTFDSDATDSLDNNNGTVSGAAQATGKINNGYYFDGSDHITFFNLDDTSNWSYSMWVNIKDRMSTGNDEILNGGNHNPRIVYYGNTDEFRVMYKNSTGDYQSPILESGDSSVSFDTWYHLAIVHNTTHMLMYVDGNLVDTLTLVGGIYSHANVFRIGYTWGDSINGTIDELGVWNRVLDSDEVAGLYNNGSGLQYPFGDVSETIWSREDICPSWTGNSGWNTAEFRAHIDNTSSSYDEVRFKFCAGTDEPLRILNLSVCYTEDSSPTTDETCSDFVTHTGDGATGDWRYIEISAGECEWSDWLDYDWQSGREHFLQWGTQSGSYDGNKYVSGCSSNRLSRLVDTVAHVMNPSWTSDSWEGYMYDLEEVQGRSNTSQSNTTNNFSYSGDCDSSCHVAGPNYNATITEGTINYLYVDDFDWANGGVGTGNAYGQIYCSAWRMNPAITGTECDLTENSDSISVNCSNSYANQNWTFYETYIDATSTCSGNYRLYNYFKVRSGASRGFNWWGNLSTATSWTDNNSMDGIFGLGYPTINNGVVAIKWDESVVTDFDYTLGDTDYAGMSIGRNSEITAGTWLEWRLKVLDASEEYLKPINRFNNDPYYQEDNFSVVWEKEKIADSWWSGDSAFTTSEYRLYTSTGSDQYDQIRFKFCAGTDTNLDVINISVCETTYNSDADATCIDDLITLGSYDVDKHMCQWSDWYNYSWDHNYHFIQWGATDGNRYLYSFPSDLARHDGSNAHVLNPSFRSGETWEAYVYDIEEIQGRSSGSGSDSCTCPGLNQDWEIDMKDGCEITSNCDLGIGSLSFANTGNFTCAATISCASVEMMTIGQQGIITDDCVFDIE